MSSSLSNLLDNLFKGLLNKKCGKCKSCLEYMSSEGIKLIFNAQTVKLYFNKDFINRFANTYEFCNKDINKFILFLRKGIYPYEYMDSWERFDETFLPNK